MGLTEAPWRDPLDAAREVIETAERLEERIVTALRSRIRTRTAPARDSSPEPLDDHQLVCYELARSASELAAARAVLEYAASLREAAAAGGSAEAGPAAVEEPCALLFIAEMAQSLRDRLSARPADFGLSWQELSQSLEREPVRSFCSARLAAASMEALGELLRQGQKAGSAGGLSLLDEEHEEQRGRFREFTDRVVRPMAERIHREDLLVPESILTPLIGMGAFGLSIPRRFGGRQEDGREDTLGMIVVTEELSRGSLGAAGSLITRTEILARAIRKGGTDEQQAWWLPKLAAGDPLCAVAVTEPDYGSDVASMKVAARRTEGGWLLDGTKTWCTFGGKAGLLLVLARTDPDRSLGHKGLSLFLVGKPPTDGKEFDHVQEGGGQVRGKAIPTIGYRGMHSFWIVFRNYFVPENALLGGEAGLGKGFYYLMAGFSGGRIQTAARAVGVMQAAFEEALSYASRRVVFGRPVADYQLTKVKLARMAALLTTSRQFTRSVARLMDRGKGQTEASMVKLFTCRAAEGITREAMQIHGGKGYAEGTPVSRHFVDARVLSIFEGAEETLALKVIARSLVEEQ
ncbi:MAG: acyl-CoA dehydrogenase family protein [bacterium]